MESFDDDNVINDIEITTRTIDKYIKDVQEGKRIVASEIIN
jgi:hypothetical protein